ncbi:actin-binding LIM protein 1-like isoform X9 [Salvelinus fontinalis]|uniref:actin-binding LIM protein 1-like isoform X9 n=1 Tax=Salvelinus fontinalis TaxID=8038 RepID=UPI002484EAF3|nr:actin-binding LIM protein 1-like isoform X9 [Salvelinus fontinalis]
MFHLCLACIAHFSLKDTPSPWTHFLHITPHFLISFTWISMVMVKEKVAHAQDTHHSNEKLLIQCYKCGEPCKGEVLRVQSKHFHLKCFTCKGCTGCGRDIKNGQALLALERQWHLGCFKCKACQKVLTGEYISKDGAPYCEKDYQIHFGVQCEACQQFITGKVLEAGDKHYHPSCARCSRCNQMFTEGEEMYLQGSTVWHPGCKNTTRTEEQQREQPSRSSSESICSRPGSSIHGSPGHTIYAKVDNEILEYKDLAAIPKVKAIYDIDRPDLITYEPLYTLSLDEREERRESVGELHTARRERSPMPDDKSCYDIRERILQRSTSQGSIGSPVYNRHSYTPLSRSPQHFHRPEALTGMQKLCSALCSNSVGSSSHSDSRPTSPFRHHFFPHSQGTDPQSGRSSPIPQRPDSRPVTPPLSLTPKHFHLPDQGINIYRKPPIYKQHDSPAPKRKSADEIIRSATFPAAHVPPLDDTSPSKSDHWPPCALSRALVALGSEGGRRRSREEEEEEALKRKQLQEEHINKIQSGLGKLIMKEENEKEQIRERSQSAQRYDPQQTNCDGDDSKTSSLPGYGRNGLHRPQSTDFTPYNSHGNMCGGGREFQVCRSFAYPQISFIMQFHFACFLLTLYPGSQTSCYPECQPTPAKCLHHY